MNNNNNNLIDQLMQLDSSMQDQAQTYEQIKPFDSVNNNNFISNSSNKNDELLKKAFIGNNYEEIMSFAFNCTYDNTLHLYDSFNNHFDSGDMRIKIDNVVESLTGEILLDYEEKNNSVRYIALLDYFYNAIPTLYSIKFESHDGDSIYYVNELRSFSTKRLILLIGLFTIITLHHLINIS